MPHTRQAWPLAYKVFFLLPASAYSTHQQAPPHEISRRVTGLQKQHMHFRHTGKEHLLNLPLKGSQS
ncbi:hypothetical protein [Paraburkholderia youngii]|uniref:Uncharacterized protein n=1 Tax=Paraburkholderia youngii TaxID=2782701 RepID=A0A7W8LCV1_9BURK|nr:hypothetical protein [Paraburkholderia youngii]MBB5404675.1 hypothetical protein [Paraburkholderia youngii]